MDYGETMKGSRLVDVLDDEVFDKTKWDMIIGKLKKLGTAIEMHFGERLPIDHVEYRWVTDRIEYYESEERLLNKAEMENANKLWSIYGKK